MTDYSAIFNCPGCGSPLQILEGTISLRCSYCGLVMRLGSPGRILKYYYESKLDAFGVKFAVERYLKEKGLSLKYSEVNRKLYHIPFYRFRGMSYALFAENTFEEEKDPDGEILPPVKKTEYQRKCRHFDLTISAYDDRRFALDSLGVRPQVMPLTVYRKENFPADSTAVDITLSPEEAEEKGMGLFYFGVGISSMNKEYLSSEMIGEGLSVIYYPVWAYEIDQEGMVSTLLIDGLAKEVYFETTDSFEYHGKGADRSRAVELNPVEHKCPNCGFDLPVSDVSLFYHCANCGRSYMLKDDHYVPTKPVCASLEEGSYYHPFWRFRFTVEEFETVHDFSRILTGEIPLIAKTKAENPFYIYAPAFKSKDLNSLTTLGTRICRTQPVLSIQEDPRNYAAEMVLPESEGLELSRFYWNLLRSKYSYLSGAEYDFESCQVSPGELIWIGLGQSHGIRKRTDTEEILSPY